MQLDSIAINDGFPEGVWLEVLFRFLLERPDLTFVFQGDDEFLWKKVYFNGARFSVTARLPIFTRSPCQLSCISACLVAD